MELAERLHLVNHLGGDKFVSDADQYYKSSLEKLSKDYQGQVNKFKADLAMYQVPLDKEEKKRRSLIKKMYLNKSSASSEIFVVIRV